MLKIIYQQSLMHGTGREYAHLAYISTPLFYDNHDNLYARIERSSAGITTYWMDAQLSYTNSELDPRHGRLMAEDYESRKTLSDEDHGGCTVQWGCRDRDFLEHCIGKPSKILLLEWTIGNHILARGENQTGSGGQGLDRCRYSPNNPRIHTRHIKSTQGNRSG